MAYDSKTERLISLKKLAGKAQTSNDKGLSNEALPSGITISSNTVFGETISTAPGSSALWDITGKVEYLRLPVTYIAGSDTSSGRHGFEIKLPSTYNANSSNPKKGTYPFIDSQSICITSGALQLVPPQYATAYEAKPFYGGTEGSKGSGTQIPLLDSRDWYLDYFNGVFFQQDPPGTGAHAENPDYIEAFLYIGDMLDAVVAGGGTATGGFFTSPTNGLLNTTGSVAFAGPLGSSYTVSSVGADTSFFVSGTIDSRGTTTAGSSVFGGDVIISGTLSVNRGQAGVGSMFTVTSDGKVGIGSDSPAYKLSVGGNMDVGEYIYHKNDADTYIRYQPDQIDFSAGGQNLLTLREHSQDTVTIGSNEEDIDFQVITSGSDYTLFVRGDTDRVGIGLNGPATKLHIKGESPTVRIQRDNQTETSALDFAGAGGVPGASITHAGLTNDLVFSVFNSSELEEILRLGDYYSGNKRQVIFLSGSGMHSTAVQPEKCSDVAFFVSGAIGSRGSTTLGTAVFGGDLVTSGTLRSLEGISGSLTQLVDGTSYLIAGSNTVITTGSSGAITISSAGGVSNSSPFVTWEAAAGLSDERILTASSGFSIVNNGVDKVILTTDPQKVHYNVSQSHTSLHPMSIPGIKFSDNSYSYSKTDVYLNGVLMLSGTSEDYYLEGDTSSVTFTFNLETNDTLLFKLN